MERGEGGNNNALQQQFNCNSFCNHQYVVQLNFPLPGSSFFLLLCCKKKILNYSNNKQ